MQDLNESIISPMLSSPMADAARAITDSSHVKPQPAEPLTDAEIEQVETWEWSLGDHNFRRLIATVRALQRDLAEARAKLVDARELLKEMS